MSAVVTVSPSRSFDRDKLPFIVMGSEPTGHGTWSRLTGRTFDIATDYGHEMGDWYLRCNISRIGPGTRALIFRWVGRGMPDLGGLMKVTDFPVKQQEPRAPGGYLYYVWGEIHSLYPNDYVKGQVIAADPQFSGTRPLKPVPNRFQCGERYLASDVKVCISKLRTDVRDWFWA